MAKYPRKTTKEEFAEFKAECERLIPLFDLCSWTIDILHEPLGPGNCGLAECNSTGRVARVTLTNVIEDDRIDRIYKLGGGAKATARHEMTHILLGRIEYISNCRFCQEEEISDALEHLCRVFEKLSLTPDVED